MSISQRRRWRRRARPALDSAARGDSLRCACLPRRTRLSPEPCWSLTPSSALSHRLATPLLQHTPESPHNSKLVLYPLASPVRPRAFWAGPRPWARPYVYVYSRLQRWYRKTMKRAATGLDSQTACVNDPASSALLVPAPLAPELEAPAHMGSAVQALWPMRCSLTRHRGLKEACALGLLSLALLILQ